MGERSDTRGAGRAEPDIHRLALEHAQDLVSVLDLEGRVVYASPSHERVLGYTPEELVGTDPLELVDPRDRRVAAAAMSAEGGLAAPVRMRHRDGRLLIVEGRVTPIPGEGLLLAVSRDITLRARAERRRDAQYAVTRLLAGARTVEGAASEVLQTVCERLDWDTGVLWRCDDEGALRHAAHWPPDEPPATRGLAARVARSREPAWAPEGECTTVAVPVGGRRGTWGVLEFAGTKIRQADEDRLRVFASFGAQVGQFIERTQAEGALHESRSMLSAVVEGASDAVFVKDRDGRYLLINEAGAAALGRPVDEVVGADDGELMAPDAAAAIMAHDSVVVERGETVVAEELVDTDDGARLFLATKAPYRGEDGEVLGLIGIAHDVTDRRRLEAELQQAQKMEAVGRLAGGVAHDFNNILAVIRGVSDLARKHLAGSDATVDEWLRQVSRATEQGTGLTRQLLSFSRRQPLDTEVLQLNAVVAEMDALLRRVLGEDLRLVTVFGASPGTVEANRGQLEQVIMNLAVNARDAMPDGGKLTVETADAVLGEDAAERLGGLEPGPYVVLRVSDTGTGMDADTRMRIFEPFFTTKEAGRGTGLGLSTVYGIVSQAGGHIGVHSEPGAGSTFAIHLPAARPAAATAAGEPQLPPAAALSGTLLVAEDDDVLRGLIRSMLQQGGYDVLTAGSGEEALASAAAFAGRIDALVTDVIMPGMRGPELAARLRVERPQLRVVFVTGYTNEPVEQELRPGDALLTKPFGMDALLATLEEVLPEARAANSAVSGYYCVACGAQHAPSEDPPERCPVCEDARQYVPEDGQKWTTPAELASRHRCEVRDDGAYTGVGMEPAFAIGQRALLVPLGERVLMWDCIPLVDDAAAEEVERRGGLAAIAISHPHYYTGMVEWAHRFGCPVLLHADDARWIMRPDPAVELWDGETRALGDGLTLIRCGGHFAGGAVLHDARAGALLSGDIVQVIPDRRHVGFMYSYPNLIPLPEATVRAIERALEPYEYDAIYGAWWGRIVRSDGKGAVARSAERYGRALRGELA